MERLSNIMRTGQGAYQAAHQRFPQQTDHGSVPERGAAPARRPQPSEQGGVARANVPGNYRARPTLPPRAAQDEQWEESLPSSPRQAQRPTYTSQRVPRVPQSTRYSEQPPQGDYYTEDERSTIVPADAEEEWSDDIAGMRYDDWEDAPAYRSASEYAEEDEYELPGSRPREVNSAPRPISQAAQRMAQNYARNEPLTTRQLYRVGPESQRPPSVREIRESHLPITTPGSQLTPTQRPLRTTQPLKPEQQQRARAEIQQLRRNNAEVGQNPRALQPAQPVLPATPRVNGADYTIMVGSAQTVCPRCNGAGFLRQNVPFGHPQFGKAVACECKEQERKRKRRLQLQELSNLGAFSNKRFNTFNPRVPGMQEAFEAALDFASGPDGWLVLVGPNGCGKTHLAAAIANECLEAGAVVLFATVPDLLDHLRAAFAPDASEVYDQLFARMREAEVLVLDDLGAQQSSPWASEKLFQLLNYRYNSGFPTVITANRKGLDATDDRIKSRLSDFSLVDRIELDHAQDFRPRNPRRD